MSYGFVYLLGNKAMPTYYKIGCTERSPYARAREISRATGVPEPFHVLLYIEAQDFQRTERRFHQELSDFRATTEREFFCFGPEHMQWLWWVFKSFPQRLSFATAEWHLYATTPLFPEDYLKTWIDGGDYLHMPSRPPLEGWVEVTA